ncbi:unnamed protein product [Mycena citricolor]|uniref:ubiquitinyl hydrolase 1 n=1 Tax=Mycena citricolor TaxID=2018698 RepID=A0AAD2H3J1_9AGAR|nr:unnamed protein product [Mycena citricolor]CAK5267544.1 unnamed protein product [Mycena citricolor]CAK5283203.1 unnamed protein product [Mycena citricolor]
MLLNLVAASSTDLGSVSLTKHTEGVQPELVAMLRLMQLDRDDPHYLLDNIDGATTVMRKPMSDFLSNPFVSVFTALRDLRTRRLAENYEHVLDGVSWDNGKSLSNESEEDKGERASQELLFRLMDVILQFFSRQKQGADWLRSTGAELKLGSSFACSPGDYKRFLKRKAEEEERERKRKEKARRNSNPVDITAERNRLTAELEEEDVADPLDHVSDIEEEGEDPGSSKRIHFSSTDDGYMYLGRAGKTSGSNRFSKIPVVRYEAKRLKAMNVQKNRPKQLKKERAFFKRQYAVDRSGSADDPQFMGTDQPEAVLETNHISRAALKVISQQFAEMLTGIYVNLHYRNDYERREKERDKLEKALFDALPDAEKRKMAADLAKTMSAAGQEKAWLYRQELSRDAHLAHGNDVVTPRNVDFLEKEGLDCEDADTAQAQDEPSGEMEIETRKNSRPRVPLSKPYNAKRIGEIGEWQHQQGFTIHIRHTYISFSRIDVTADYLEKAATLECLKEGSVEFKQTREFDLLYAHDRYEAGRAIWALLSFLHGEGEEKPAIGRLQTAAKRNFGTYFPLMHMDGKPGDPGLDLKGSGSNGSNLERIDDPDHVANATDPGPNKLINVGNTCYANALIQSLAATITPEQLDELEKLVADNYEATWAPTKFVQALKDVNGPPKTGLSLEHLVWTQEELQKIKTEEAGERKTEAARKLNGLPPATISEPERKWRETRTRTREKLRKETLDLERGKQEDPLQMLDVLLGTAFDVPGAEMKLLQLDIKEVFTCTGGTCSGQKGKVDPDYVLRLHLDLVEKPLEELVKAAFAARPLELLSYACPMPSRCYTGVTVQREITKHPGPPILAVHLNRALNIHYGNNQITDGVPLAILRQIVADRTELAAGLAQGEHELVQLRNNLRPKMKVQYEKDKAAAAFFGADLSKLDDSKEMKDLQKEYADAKSRTVDALRNSKPQTPRKTHAPVNLFNADGTTETLVLPITSATGNRRGDVSYELYAVVCHRGTTVDSGHYVAYVRRDDIWFKCDDDLISKIGDSTALQTTFNIDAAQHVAYQDDTGANKGYWEEKGKDGESDQPYLLFYRRIEPVPAI